MTPEQVADRERRSDPMTPDDVPTDSQEDEPPTEEDNKVSQLMDVIEKRLSKHGIEPLDRSPKSCTRYYQADDRFFNILRVSDHWPTMNHVRHLDPENPQLSLLVDPDMTERQAEEAADAAIGAITRYIEAFDAWAAREWAARQGAAREAWDERQPPLVAPEGPWFETCP
jgi:hypothetical protein